MNETTLFIVQILGPISLVGGLGLFFNLKMYRKIMKKLDDSSLLLYTMGFASLAVGLVIVLKHNLWGSAPEVIVTLFGWAGMIKGISLVIAPHAVVKFSKKMATCKIFAIAPFAWLALGVYLTWVGYFA